MLFHYDGNVEEWMQFQWNDLVIYVSAVNQTKWWFAKRFLHRDIVDQYSRILLRDEDLGVDNFNPQRYVSIVRKEGLEISQPALDFFKTEVNYMEKLSKDEGIQKKLSKDILQYKAHIIKIFVEHRHNWISADLEF
ncbi:uncharacterized protein LOC133729013 isoform X2 [Rosa rugosa]|nr:uncharacterized protein LOC133720163 isoform X2 [Rosa rugosa]XP_062012466.1 uncharacterized protein LOC133729012 isoform X2 [Rosa rugosa]XP_062012469.1 uncharacterized protein LOC133729013 isoform X2 [Rosa rugosa]